MLSGKEWRLLELANPVSLPEGGWFAITLTNPSSGLYLAAPQIVPSTAMALSVVRPLGAVRSRTMTEVERGAVLHYGRLLRTPTPPQRRPRPKRADGPEP